MGLLNNELLQKIIDTRKILIEECRDKYPENAVADSLVVGFLEELQKYRSIGPSPEQLKEIDQMHSELSKELMHYRNLKQQGRLLELPCAVGDTVYTIYDGEEDGTFIEDPTVKEVSTHRIWIGAFAMCFDYADIGKTVFLTKQDAEDKLKELEG